MKKDKSEKGVKYKVRNKYHEIVATKTKADILKRITSGKYHGDEEISAPPYLVWHKISSHPDFYDAFLRRIFKDRYPKENKNENQENSFSRLHGKENEIDRVNDAENEPAGTVKLSSNITGMEEEKDAGVTVHQSEIEQLFGLESEPKGKGNEENFERKEDNPQKELDLNSGGELFGDLVEKEVDRQIEIETPKKKKSKRVLVYACVLLVMVMIYYFKRGEKESELTENDGGGRSNEQSVRHLITSTVDENGLVDALLEEAVQVSGNDELLFYKAAAEILKEAHQIKKSDIRVVTALVESLARSVSYGDDFKSRKEELIRRIKEGRGLDPQNGAFYRAEAILALEENKLDVARETIQSALDVDPVQVSNWLVLGEILYARGEMAQAMDSFKSVIKQSNDNIRARHFLSRIALVVGDMATAKKQALEALRVNPFHSGAYQVIGEVESMQNNFSEAMQLFKASGKLAALTYKKTSAESYYKLGKILELSGDSVGAKKAYSFAYYYKKDYAGGLESKIKGKGSVEEIGKEIKKEEYDSDYFLSQGSELAAQRKTRDALKFFQVAAIMKPESQELLIKLGENLEKVAVTQDEIRRVMNIYLRAIEKKIDGPMGYVRLGLIETEQLNLDRAFILLQQAEELAPGDPDVLVSLGKHFYKRQDFQKSIDYFLRAARIRPEDSETQYYGGLLRSVYKDGDSNEAMSFFQNAYNLNSENYDALCELLKLKVKAFEKNYAVKYMRGLIEENPNNENLYWVLGEVYAANDEHRRAIKYFHEGLDKNNKASRLRMSLAKSLEAIGDVAKASAEYRLSSMLDRKNSEGFFMAAKLLFEVKDFNSSEKVLKELLVASPNYPGVNLLMSQIFQNRGMKKEALEFMEKEVSNNPENYKFVLELAQLYIRYEMFEKAIKEVNKVTNLPHHRKAPVYVYEKIRAYLLLSRCYRALNKAESAEASIALALEIDPEDPELHRELGYVYYTLGRDKEGVRSFEYYLKRKPAAEDAQAIKRLIEKMQIKRY